MVARVQGLSTRLNEKDRLLMERTEGLNVALVFLTGIGTISEEGMVGWLMSSAFCVLPNA